MKDAVLIVGAGHLQCHAIRTVQALGFAALVTDQDPQAPGIALVDRWYPVSTQDVLAHVLLVPQIRQEYRLCGVMTAGADVAPTVAAVAEEAGGLPSIPLWAALITHNKAEVRRRLAHAGLQHYQPQWFLWQGSPVCDSYREVESVGYPLVVKPLSQSASRGVSIVQNVAGLEAALTKARQYGEDALLESCLSGTEHSAEMLLDNGTIRWWNIVDRIFQYHAGVPLEVGHVNSSALPKQAWDDARKMMMRAAAALGVSWGPFKCDMMMTNAGPKILECTARLSGGFDSQGTSLALGLDPTRQLVQMTCGLPVDIPSKLSLRYAACAAAFPTPGYVVKDPDILYTPGLVDVILMRTVGDTIEPYTHCATRPAFVLAEGDTYKEAWCRACTAAAAVADGYVTTQTSA